ncbi:MAG: hypothetical protein NZ908_02015, partial [Candidatus Micrarchaeota archaeon]|nr:hypothetical protein [Candidatus Micrarchaeota archaeon]
MESTVEIIRNKINKNTKFLGRSMSLGNLVNTKNDEKLIINLYRFFRGVLIQSIPHHHRGDIDPTTIEFGTVHLINIFTDLLNVFENIKNISIEYGHLIRERTGERRFYTDVYITINDLDFSVSPDPYGKPLYL